MISGSIEGSSSFVLSDSKVFGVLGLGESGKAGAALMLDLGKRVILFDDNHLSRPDPLLDAMVARGAKLLHGGNSSKSEAFDSVVGLDALIISPGIKLEHPIVAAARQRGIPIRAELELGWLCREGARLAAITGTNGKTTVTMLTEALFRDAGLPTRAVGNIGFALSEAVRPGGPDGGGPELSAKERAARLAKMVYACEVSSFQLETTEHFKPEVAVILNVTPDHLDRHGSMEEYARLKGRITENQSAGDVLVVNQDDQYCLEIAQRSRARVMRFSLIRAVDDGAWLDGDVLTLERPGKKAQALLKMSELQMFGLHNVANALAAACIGEAFGIAPKIVAQTLKSFRAAPHRMELVGTLNGIRYVDDSKATNIDAMCRALESFEGGIHLIAGGRDKASPFETVTELLAQRVEAVYLIGEAATPMFAAWNGRVECVQCGTMDNAMQIATERILGGGVADAVVLLSPGCASFDQFRNYAHRGEVFAQWVAQQPGAVMWKVFGAGGDGH